MQNITQRGGPLIGHISEQAMVSGERHHFAAERLGEGAHKTRHLGCLPFSVGQASSGLLERVRVALQRLQYFLSSLIASDVIEGGAFVS